MEMHIIIVTGWLNVDDYPSRIFLDWNYCVLVGGFQPNAWRELFKVQFGLSGVR